jgi:integrase
MNDKQIKSFLRTGVKTRKPVGDGLYIRVQTKGLAYWEVRYTINGKRRFMTIEGGQYPTMPLVAAKAEAATIKFLAKSGKDPLAQRNRQDNGLPKTVDGLFEIWYAKLRKRIKSHANNKRHYLNEIKPIIGNLAITQVLPTDIQSILDKIVNSNRPTVANKTLICCKQLFNEACKFNFITFNPAANFKVSDAGGEEKSRDRALSEPELAIAFKVLRDNSDIFTRDNYLALALLVSLGVRKGELIAAQWQEFNFEKQDWSLPAERSKTGTAINIPLPDDIIPWFEELHIRSCGSNYVFPSRRASKRRGYISDDTLNHALAKVLGKKVDSKKQPYENFLGKAGVNDFTPHDLRRTCRTLLSGLGITKDIAKKCLNHKIEGIDGTYDRYDYFEERREALTKLSDLIAPLVNDDSKVIPF